MIAVGIATEAARYAQSYTTSVHLRRIQQSRMGDSLWYSHVVLVSRHDDNIARGVAFDIVEIRLWHDCGPEWRTNVMA